MTVLPVLPDMEARVGEWLRDHPDLAALDVRVAGRTPASLSRPWIRVTQLAAQDDDQSGREWFVEWMLQLDCYAGDQAMQDHAGQAEASAVTRAARAILKARQDTVSNDIAVKQVVFQGASRIPDIDFEPARERYILTVLIKAHAVSV